VFDRYNVTSEKDIHAAAALLSAHHRALHRTARMTKSLQSKRTAKNRERRAA
jgi:hypothetical protein